jgi:basic membrane lipoprotein Med (substrate-binding protein (PBP1-ABC) superfamily)
LYFRKELSMKRRFFLTTGVLSLCSALWLGGCGGNSNTTTTATKTATNTTSTQPLKPLKIALLTPSDINDQGWNQLAYEGLKQVEKETGAMVSHQVTKSASDQQPAMQDFADQGYDLLLLHGFEYGERAKAVAKNFPKTKFVVVSGNVTQEPNVATLIPKLEDATYLLGMAAGGMTKTGKVGLIGGMELPVIQSTFDAFTLGAKAANPKVQVLKPVYIGNFEDQNAGKEAAKSLISQGADILLHNADQAGKGMFVAAKEAGGKVLVFGSNRDQNSVAPNVTLGSAVIEMPRAFVEITKAVQHNNFKAQFYELNLGNGDITVHWNAALKSKIPPALMKKIEAAEAQIKSGKLKIKRKV